MGVAIIPHILTAADVFDRVYKLIRRIQTDRVESRNKDVMALQADIDKLGEILELQTQLLQKKDIELADLVARVEKLEAKKKFLFW